MNVVETRVVGITKAVPLEVFKKFHHWAYFAELMPHTKDGKVIWDEKVTSIYSEQAAEAEWTALQNDWLGINMELPVEWTGSGEPEQIGLFDSANEP